MCLGNMQSISGYPRKIRPTLVDVAVAHAREIARKARVEDLVREERDFVIEYAIRLMMQKPWFSAYTHNF